MSLSKLRENIFELQALEIRRLLTTATVDSNHILQILGTTGVDNITVNKNSAGKLTVSGVTATFTIGSAAGQANAINIQASDGNDVVLLTSNVKNGTAGIPSTIAGNNGNDSLTGGPGNDVLSGGAGNDTLDGGVGNDQMTGGDNTDTSNYSNRTGALRITMGNGANDGEVAIGEADDVETEEVIGGAGNDTITGSSLQDFIAGGGGADSLSGGDGNDQLTSSSGSSQLLGQNGNDALYAQNGNKDTVNGGTNTDHTSDFDTALVDGVDVGSVSSLLAAATAPPPKGGDLDPTYGTGGKTLAADLGWNSINGSAIDSQGRAYFVGTVADPNDSFGGSFNDDMAVARFNANGTFDTTFSGGNVANVPAGQARVDFTPIDTGSGYGSHFTDDFASGIIIAPGDKVILLGSTNPSNGDPTAMAVARLNSDGTMDTTFGVPNNFTAGRTGLQKISIGNGYGSGYGGDDAIDAVVQADGMIDIAGTHSQDFAVARLLSDGTLDASAVDPTGSFNGVGYNTLDVNDGSSDFADAIALQTLTADGGKQRIIVGGDADGQFAIARFNADGSFDTSFGSAGGVVLSDFGGSNSLNDLAVNSQNQIVAVGNVSDQIAGISGLASVASGQEDGILAVYAATGQGAPSVVDQPPTSGNAISFDAVAIDSQNRIVIAGDQNNDIIVGRYLSNLSVDGSFANGFVTVDFTPAGTETNNDDFPLAVSVLSTKTVVVSGETFPGSEGDAQAIAMRFKGDVSNVPPGTNEGDVEEVEGFIDYNSLHQVPPPPAIAALLNQLSPAARLYVLSKPDNQGVARFQLSDAANNVTIGTEVAGDGKLNVIVTVDGFTMYYDAAKLTRIEINGNGGNDSIIAANNLPVPLVIDGGAGNDIINGGAKNDVLLGGPGIDLIDGQGGADAIVGGSDSDGLYGDDGNDIIIGGTGLDLMAGGNGDDIEIAGTTSYDTNVTALQNLIAEWSSANTNAVRVAHIRGTLPGGLNNPYVLKVGVGATVFDDGIADILTNDSGRDWFFFHNTGSILVRDQVLFGTGTDEVTFI